MNLLAKILLSIAAIQFGFIPAFVDFTETHVFHPDWPPHARFHLVWLLTSGVVFASGVLVAIWYGAKRNWQLIKHVSLIGCIVLGSFFVAVGARAYYGGSLTDSKTPIEIFGLDGNVVSFTVAALLQLIGTIIVWRSDGDEQGNT